MDIVLLKEIENLGSKYDVVSVKAGYGRNFLIPQGFAQVANVSNVKHVEELRKQQSAKIAKMVENLKALSAKLKASKVKVGAKAGTSGKLFGSVTNIQVADAIKKELDIEIDRKKIHLQEVKEIGVHKATAHLHKEVVVEFEFEVIQE